MKTTFKIKNINYQFLKSAAECRHPYSEFTYSKPTEK